MLGGWGTQYLPELLKIGKTSASFCPHLFHKSYKVMRFALLITVNAKDIGLHINPNA